MSLSHELYQRAKQHIPGGVNSPVRAFNGVGGDPIFFESAQGAYVTDVDGKRYIDYVGSWGPMILGHSHPAVIQAVHKAVDSGLSFGAPTAREVELAELVGEMMPNLEMVRMVSSGTEATMTAIRLARGVTNRSFIIKFSGCYHGHSDSLLVNAGSGALTLGVPSSPGVPADFAKYTLTAEFNNLASVAALFAEHEIAAIIVEPIAGNMNLIPGSHEFLSGLRSLCDKHGSVLIFDEVMTGFRVAQGGAQELYNIKPDLTTLGKIIGGGMPVGAIGGAHSIMSQLAPSGPVYQAGTLSGNPVAMAAGIATLNTIRETKQFYETITRNTDLLLMGLRECAQASGIPLVTQFVGGMFGFFFTELSAVNSLEQVKQANLQQFKQFFHGMLNEGVYLAPSMYEAGFMSIMHGEQEIKLTIEAAERVFKTMA